jgi:hypothetical protein
MGLTCTSVLMPFATALLTSTSCPSLSQHFKTFSTLQ